MTNWTLPTCLAAAAGKVRSFSLLVRQCLFAGPGSVGTAMLLGCAKLGLSLTPWTLPELPCGCVSNLPVGTQVQPSPALLHPAHASLQEGEQAGGKEGQVKPEEYLPPRGGPGLQWPTLRQDRYQQGSPGERGSPWTPELHPLTSRKDKGSRACLGGPRGHKARLMEVTLEPGASRAILQEERRAQEGCCGDWRWQNNDG